MQSTDLAGVTSVQFPKRYALYTVAGLAISCLAHAATEVQATAVPYRSRGATCRRVAVQTAQGRYIIELASINEQYGPDVLGVIRANDGNFENGVLSLVEARFKSFPVELLDLVALREAAKQAWIQGVTYRDELVDANGALVQAGLRTAQAGALHAIASHRTISKEPALVVMPTGTGKTEVMIAAAVSGRCNRVLVIVPTDALRQQTCDRFEDYGLLRTIGVVPDIPNPVIGLLDATPTANHIAALEHCNIVVSTMQSIGLATDAVQRRMAALFSDVFLDEGHHSEAATWRKFREHCRDARVLMFTATPFREDGKPLDGKMIYEFPLSAAQEQQYFRPIRFIEVFEPNRADSDLSIAQAAVNRLRQDLLAGHDHILMARAATIQQAIDLHRQIYQQRFGDLNPVVIHSRSAGRRALLEAIRNRRHRIIVCVNMFGEGFDLPQLKIAALHSVHKSLGVTLQFIGRFARNARNVGEAAFVANTAEDGVPESLESLYREDADWNSLLAGLSYDAINPQAQLSELVSNLRDAQPEATGPAISTLALRPKISCQVYRTQEFHPQRFNKAFRKGQRVYQPQISARDNFLVLVVNQQDAIDWTDSREIAFDAWDLYLAHFDPNRNLLFCHSSRKGGATDVLARAISRDPELIQGEDTFKTFGNLKRLVLHSVGLSSRSRNVRYQMFAGLDVRNAIDPVLQQDKMKSNVTGVGYEYGRRRTAGASRKGKIWAMASGSLAEWKNWCDHIGQKLVDPNLQPDDFLRHTLVPTVVNGLPDGVPIMVDWPDQLFEAWNFRFAARLADGTAHSFHDCELALESWSQATSSFRFVLKAGENTASTFELRITPVAGRDSTYAVTHAGGTQLDVELGSDRKAAAEFFTTNPPLVRLADGSQLSGNISLKPREDLAEVFDRNRIAFLDWTGIDITKESRWKDGQLREDSIQHHFIESLLHGLSTFVIDDDDSGESADVVAIEEAGDVITIYLWHCKFSTGNDPGQRASDLYVVCGQAQKSVKWTWSLDNLVKHLMKRETELLNGRNTRFLRGTLNQLVTLRKGARRKRVEFKIGIVQPGLSQAAVLNEHLTMLGATNSFIQTVTDNPLLVMASA